MLFRSDNMVETEAFFVKSVRKTAKEKKRNIKQNAGLHGLSCLMRTEKSTDIPMPNPQGRTGLYTKGRNYNFIMQTVKMPVGAMGKAGIRAACSKALPRYLREITGR